MKTVKLFTQLFEPAFIAFYKELLGWLAEDYISGSLYSAFKKTRLKRSKVGVVCII